MARAAADAYDLGTASADAAAGIYAPERATANVGATQALTAATYRAAPVGALLAGLGPDAAEAARAALVQGAILGQNPRKTARQMVAAADGLSKQRARRSRAPRRSARSAPRASTATASTASSSTGGRGTARSTAAPAPRVGDARHRPPPRRGDGRARQLPVPRPARPRPRRGGDEGVPRRAERPQDEGRHRAAGRRVPRHARRARLHEAGPRPTSAPCSARAGSALTRRARRRCSR